MTEVLNQMAAMSLENTPLKAKVNGDLTIMRNDIVVLEEKIKKED